MREIKMDQFGGLEKRHVGELRDIYFKAFQQDPEAFEIEGFKGRKLKRWLDALFDKDITTNQARSTAIGTHGITIINALMSALKIPYNRMGPVLKKLGFSPNVGITVMAYNEQTGEWKLLIYGDSSYLPRFMRLWYQPYDNKVVRYLGKRLVKPMHILAEKIFFKFQIAWRNLRPRLGLADPKDLFDYRPTPRVLRQPSAEEIARMTALARQFEQEHQVSASRLAASNGTGSEAVLEESQRLVSILQPWMDLAQSTLAGLKIPEDPLSEPTREKLKRLDTEFPWIKRKEMVRMLSFERTDLRRALGFNFVHYYRNDALGALWGIRDCLLDNHLTSEQIRVLRQGFNIFKTFVDFYLRSPLQHGGQDVYAQISRRAAETAQTSSSGARLAATEDAAANYRRLFAQMERQDRDLLTARGLNEQELALRRWVTQQGVPIPKQVLVFDHQIDPAANDRLGQVSQEFVALLGSKNPGLAKKFLPIGANLRHLTLAGGDLSRCAGYDPRVFENAANRAPAMQTRVNRLALFKGGIVVFEVDPETSADLAAIDGLTGSVLDQIRGLGDFRPRIRYHVTAGYLKEPIDPKEARDLIDAMEEASGRIESIPLVLNGGYLAIAGGFSGVRDDERYLPFGGARRVPSADVVLDDAEPLSSKVPVMTNLELDRLHSRGIPGRGMFRDYSRHDLLDLDLVGTDWSVLRPGVAADSSALSATYGANYCSILAVCAPRPGTTDLDLGVAHLPDPGFQDGSYVRHNSGELNFDRSKRMLFELPPGSEELLLVVDFGISSAAQARMDLREYKVYIDSALRGKKYKVLFFTRSSDVLSALTLSAKGVGISHLVNRKTQETQRRFSWARLRDLFDRHTTGGHYAYINLYPDWTVGSEFCRSASAGARMAPQAPVPVQEIVAQLLDIVNSVLAHQVSYLTWYRDDREISDMPDLIGKLMEWKAKAIMISRQKAAPIPGLERQLWDLSEWQREIPDQIDQLIRDLNGKNSPEIKRVLRKSKGIFNARQLQLGALARQLEAAFPAIENPPNNALVDMSKWSSWVGLSTVLSLSIFTAVLGASLILSLSKDLFLIQLPEWGDPLFDLELAAISGLVGFAVPLVNAVIVKIFKQGSRLGALTSISMVAGDRGSSRLQRLSGARMAGLDGEAPDGTQWEIFDENNPIAEIAFWPADKERAGQVFFDFTAPAAETWTARVWACEYMVYRGIYPLLRSGVTIEAIITSLKAVKDSRDFLTWLLRAHKSQQPSFAAELARRLGIQPAGKIQSSLDERDYEWAGLDAIRTATMEVFAAQERVERRYPRKKLWRYALGLIVRSQLKSLSDQLVEIELGKAYEADWNKYLAKVDAIREQLSRIAPEAELPAGSRTSHVGSDFSLHGMAEDAKKTYTVKLAKLEDGSWTSKTERGLRHFKITMACPETQQLQESYRKFLLKNFGDNDVGSAFERDDWESILLLVSGGEVVGFYRMMIQDRYLEAIYVDPDYRGTGAIDVMLQDLTNRFLDGQSSQFGYNVSREHYRANREGAKTGTIEQFRKDLGLLSLVTITSDSRIPTVSARTAGARMADESDPYHFGRWSEDRENELADELFREFKSVAFGIYSMVYVAKSYSPAISRRSLRKQYADRYFDLIRSGMTLDTDGVYNKMHSIYQRFYRFGKDSSWMIAMMDQDETLLRHGWLNSLDSGTTSCRIDTRP
ncbi:MAG: GNAT family N-acetyltransferase [Candidatus Omnitrophota bacterium]